MLNLEFSEEMRFGTTGFDWDYEESDMVQRQPNQNDQMMMSSNYLEHSQNDNAIRSVREGF